MSELPASDAAELLASWRKCTSDERRRRLAEHLLLNYADMLTFDEREDLLFKHLETVLDGTITPEQIQIFLQKYGNQDRTLCWQAIEVGLRIAHKKAGATLNIDGWTSSFKDYKDAVLTLVQELDDDRESADNTPPRFIRLREIGQGGFGRVYLAEHRYRRDLVALKVIRSDGQLVTDYNCFFAEARYALQLKGHPHIVPVIDVGLDRNEAYIAFQFIGRNKTASDNLQQWLRHGPLPAREAAKIIAVIADAVHYAHVRQIYHRDIKPSNILLDDSGKPWLTDFGLATVARGQEGSVMRRGGTIAFQAPEEVGDVEEKVFPILTDVYSLGLVLYETVTGTHPFAKITDPTTLKEAIRQSTIASKLGQLPNVPGWLADICAKAMHPVPEKRYQGAGELAEALRDAIQSIPDAGTASHSARQAPSMPPARKPRWPWLIAVPVGVMSAALLMALMPSRSERRPPSGQQDDATPLPIHIKRLGVELSRNSNGRPAGLLGEEVFDPHLGDHVTVQARLTRRVYAFLIVFRPDCQVEVCFPEEPDELPAETDNPRYPSTSVGREYELTDGEGLQAFALVVSSHPLPTYREWWSQLKGCPWKKEDAPPGVVYRANGNDPVEVLGRDDPRGKGARAKGKTLIAELAAWLRRTPGAETVQVLGFTVGPSENH